jgi:hypothetical protein
MRWIFRLLALTLLVTAVTAASLVWLVLAPVPALEAQYRLGPADLARAREILRANDPRQSAVGAVQRIDLGQDDLNLAANYLLQNALGGAAAHIELDPERARLAATVRLPGLPVRPYLNLEAEILDRGTRPVLDALRIGAVSLPSPLVHWSSGRLWALLERHPDYAIVAEALHGMELTDERLTVAYRWQPELLSAVSQGLIPAEQQAAIAAYRQALLNLQAGGKGTRGSLADLLPAMFQIAEARSRRRDPADENRALLLVLGAWASGRRLDALLPEETARNHPHRFRLTLRGRRDFAQHFLISAALAANADSVLANAVGLFKEMSDVDRGSGFSFTDIAADRGGARFGEQAVGAAGRAAEVQRRLAAGVEESELLPPLGDLPEHLSEQEFAARYGEVGSPAYEAVMAEIEQRLDRVDLLGR